MCSGLVTAKEKQCLKFCSKEIVDIILEVFPKFLKRVSESYLNFGPKIVDIILEVVPIFFKRVRENYLKTVQ